VSAHRIVESPIGPLFLAADDLGLTQVLLPAGDHRHAPADGGPPTPQAESILDATEAQLDEYFAGRRRDFDLPLRFQGSDFRNRAWQQVAAIPFGQVITYGELAARAGMPRASRAAGAACGSNQIAIIVPCHRVVGSNRGLHGYGGGLDTKRWLLEHEGVRVAGGRIVPERLF
jgi:methylated-DNA-[protein]-cysteine S-methyltransferase